MRQAQEQEEEQQWLEDEVRGRQAARDGLPCPEVETTPFLDGYRLEQFLNGAN